MNASLSTCFLIFCIAFYPQPILAEDIEKPTEQTTESSEDPLAGHSYHGEAFNEGPRQAAILMPEMGSISFPTSTENENAQRFIEQGILQLHGFWYLESERSFRQASKLDPNLAIAYWGMAMANQNNATRARGFLDEALSRLDEGADEREQLYIKALDQLIPKKPNENEKDKDKDEKEEKKQRGERYLSAMEKILDQYPEDIEAKALIVVQMWMANGYGVKITSRYAVDALLNEIFAKNPAHPAHHYRIHLWDRSRPENALNAAAQCGPASPGIAHMWHMPGHIYSRLKRYQDAAWQQEASARVDHAHMIRTRLMPDQIHNFSHNNEWLIRNLIFVGRVSEALEQARNLISLPQHPKYNSLEKRGSQKYGRQRLVQILTEYGLWKTLIDESEGPFFNETGNDELDQERLTWIAVANYMLGKKESGDAIHKTLLSKQESLTEQIEKAKKEKEDREKKQKEANTEDEGKGSSETTDEDKNTEEEKNNPEDLEKEKRTLEPLLARIQCAVAAKEGNIESFKESEKKARLETILKARWYALAGDPEQAIEIAKKQHDNDPAQVRPLATLTDLLWNHEQEEEAKELFKKLRTVAAHADLETPYLSALNPIAQAVEAPVDWRNPVENAKDLGQRPSLQDLGPFRWEPYACPTWKAIDAKDRELTTATFQGKPTIMIFYLGFGCLHCVEQLHTFSPMMDDFKAAGIQVVGVSTESLEELKRGIENFEDPVDIPLMSDADQQAFKGFRCWDDFEDQPLHGTFLIDSQGKVRWQDISYEPFNDPEFLLKEAKRLLALP